MKFKLIPHRYNLRVPIFFALSTQDFYIPSASFFRSLDKVNENLYRYVYEMILCSVIDGRTHIDDNFTAQ